MAFKFMCFHLVTTLMAVDLIFADEESVRFLPFFSGNNSGFLGLPFFSSDSGLPSLPNLPFFGGQVPSFFGSRQERSADHHEADVEQQKERSLFGRTVSCNYTTQGGATCSSCRQSLVCFPDNVGRLRTCRGVLRYCNDGWCSFNPGSQCNSTNP